MEMMKTIDAGHGGGQVLRSALGLAALTGQSVHITHVRQGRPKPGLQPQHQACVNAMAKISGGSVVGNDIGSSAIGFQPNSVTGGTYQFDIGTAGSCSLLLQCVLPPLLFADAPSTVRIIGGTDVPFAPPSFFLQRAFAPALEKMGAPVTLSVERHGFYPKGHGVLKADIRPVRKLKPLDWNAKAPTIRTQAAILTAQLPEHVAQREKAVLQQAGVFDVENRAVEAAGAGNVVFLQADYPHAAMGFDALGRVGKPAQDVAKEALQKWTAFEKTPDACEPHLLDQLLAYMALADGRSRVHLGHLSEHAISNLRVLHQMLGTEHTFDGRTLMVKGKSPR